MEGKNGIEATEFNDTELESAFLRLLDYELTPFDGGYIAHRGKILFVGKETYLQNSATDTAINSLLQNIAKNLRIDLTKNNDGKWLASLTKDGHVYLGVAEAERQAILRVILQVSEASEMTADD